jgi:hypothetical protein
MTQFFAFLSRENPSTFEFVVIQRLVRKAPVEGGFSRLDISLTRDSREPAGSPKLVRSWNSRLNLRPRNQRVMSVNRDSSEAAATPFRLGNDGPVTELVAEPFSPV